MSRISSEWAIQLVWGSLTRRRVVPRAVGEQKGVYESNLRREEEPAVNDRIIASIVGNEEDVIIEGTRCNPGVGCLDRTPFSPGGERNLGPFCTQLAADGQDSVTCQLLGQFEFPPMTPGPLERPALQFSQRHKGDTEQSTCQVGAVGKRPCVSFEEHRHHVGVNDGGIHCGLEGRVPSRRQSRRLAENSSTDSSSGTGSPRRVSKSSIGVTPC